MSNVVIRRSERIYDFLLKFYPKNYRQEFGEEMKYVFSESLKEAYTEHGEPGIINLWVRIIIDTGKSLVTQHLDKQKGGDSVKTKNTNSLIHNNIFRIALGTAFLMLIPLLGKWPWTLSDFVIMGILIFGTGLSYELIVRKIGKKHRIVIAVVLLAALLLIWVELAVGLFGTPIAGS